MKRTLLLGGTLLVASLTHAQTRTYLNVGDPAPALKPAEWLKGMPPAFGKGKIAVVEFWATWCTPCKENIPHLTELAKKYAGKVSINGISIFENNDPKSTGYLKKVKTFVAGQGARMDYNVAVDTPEGAVGKAWMKAADEGGLPTTFVIDGEGKVAWIGHPKDLEATLVKLLDGSYDLQAARAKRAKDVEVVRPIHEAMLNRSYAKAIELIDQQIARKPEEERLYAYDRLVALFHTQPKVAQAESEKILTETNGDIGAYRMVASIFASQKDLSRETYEYGKVTIEQALKKDEMTYLFLAMGAEVNASLGDLKGAVAMQERAVATAEKDSHAPVDFVEFLRKNLAGFREKAKTP